MPGLYLAAIVLSAGGIVVIDARWKLAAFVAPWRTAGAVVIGVIFFLAWDGVGIITRSFVKGDSTLFVGIDLAPELPLEEVFFLAFLSYLALVVYAGALRRLLPRRDHSHTDERAKR